MWRFGITIQHCTCYHAMNDRINNTLLGLQYQIKFFIGYSSHWLWVSNDTFRLFWFVEWINKSFGAATTSVEQMQPMADNDPWRAFVGIHKPKGCQCHITSHAPGDLFHNRPPIDKRLLDLISYELQIPETPTINPIVIDSLKLDWPTRSVVLTFRGNLWIMAPARLHTSPWSGLWSQQTKKKSRSEVVINEDNQCVLNVLMDLS